MLKFTTAIFAIVTSIMTATALAQSYQPEWGSGNIVSGNPHSRSMVSHPYGGRYSSNATAAFAYAPPSQRLYGRGTTSVPGASVDKDDMRYR